MISPKQARYLKNVLSAASTVGGKVKANRRVIGAVLAGSSAAGLGYIHGKKYLNRPLPDPPKTFQAMIPVGRDHLAAELNYKKHAVGMTPRLQARIRRNPEKPVWLKYKKKTNKWDKAFSPNQKTALTVGAVGAGLVGLAAIQQNTIY